MINMFRGTSFPTMTIYGSDTKDPLRVKTALLGAQPGTWSTLLSGCSAGALLTLLSWVLSRSTVDSALLDHQLGALSTLLSWVLRRTTYDSAVLGHQLGAQLTIQIFVKL